MFLIFQRNAFGNDAIPSESYLDAILLSHLQCAASSDVSDAMCLRASLKHVTHSLIKFSEDLIMSVSKEYIFLKAHCDVLSVCADGVKTTRVHS